MKIKFSQFVFAILICFGFCNFSFTQIKPFALKFDEFSESNDYLSDSKMVTKRLKRFAIQLKKEPQMKAVIIGYDRRKQYYNNEYQIGDNAILNIQRELEGYGINEKRIVRIVGGIRENIAYELWLLPKSAEMPKLHPEFNQSDVVYCPDNVSFEGVDYTLDRNKPLEFTAYSNPGKILREVNYEWEVSTGKIVEGQGTEKIKVDISGTTENYLVVKLNFKGLALECNNQVVKKITFVKFPFKFAEFSGGGEDFKIYPYYLLQELNNNPQLRAKMFVYAPRNSGLNSLKVGIERAKRIMSFIKFPMEKLPFELGGYRENLTFEIWIYPKDAESPKPTPSVDEKFIPSLSQTKKRTFTKPKR